MSAPPDTGSPAEGAVASASPLLAGDGVGLEVTVRYFAVLRERRGCECEQVWVAAGTSVRELYRALCPPLPEGELPVMYAVNRDYVSPSSEVSDGDEVAFIPPLGGG